MVNSLKATLGAMLMAIASAHTYEVFENTDCTSNVYSIKVNTVPDANRPCSEFPPKYEDAKFKSVRFSNMNTCRFRFANGMDQCAAQTFQNSFDKGSENFCFQIPATWTAMDVVGCPPVPPSFAKMKMDAEPQMSVKHW